MLLIALATTATMIDSRLSVFAALFFYEFKIVAPANQHKIRHLQEQPSPNHTRNRQNIGLQPRRLLDRPSLAIQNAVAIVGNKDLIVLSIKSWLTTEFPQSPLT